MFDKYADEPLEGTQNCPVNHHGGFLGIVFIRIEQAKPLRHREIELNSPELPGAFQAVLYMEIYLRSIKSAVAFVDFVFDAFMDKRILKRAGGNFPYLVGPDMLFRLSR